MIRATLAVALILTATMTAKATADTSAMVRPAKIQRTCIQLYQAGRAYDALPAWKACFPVCTRPQSALVLV